MKKYQIAGLSIFVAAFLVFNLSFFLATYRLTPEMVGASVSERQRDLLLREMQPWLNETINSNFDFVERLGAALDHANEAQIAKYTITNDEIQQLASRADLRFSIDIADSVFGGDDEVSQFKRKALRDYASWMDGQEFGSQEELASQLQQVVSNIRTYGIVNQFGFDRYKIKDLKYGLTKAATLSPVKSNPLLFLFGSIGLCVVGALLYILPKRRALPGIKNDRIFFNPMKSTKWLGILTGSWLIAFYLILYFYPEYMTNWVLMVDPLSEALSGREASRFFLYGFMYTLCILVMGVRMMIHYRHSKYQMLRTISVMFFQTAFAFLIPEILIRLNQPYFDFKNIWPLDYDFFFESELNKLISSGTLGIFMLGWGIALIVVAVPVFVYFFGKRWYCSWVCGCGGLAETLGDPYRQLSDKSLKAWKIERWLVHGVLVFAVVMTAAVLYTYWTGSSWFFFVDSYKLREVYGAWIGAGFAGVVGTGFYPLMGNRVWCRFGCPLAAYLGFVQRFKSRFRITTNGGQCISCGNCSTYCEMGIDVRWYAQRGQNIVRSSCVGCGICSAVCPRGVLNLENKDEKGRFGEPVLLGNNHIKMKTL